TYLNTDFSNFIADVHSIQMPLSNASSPSAALAHTSLSSGWNDAKADLIDMMNDAILDANHQSDGGLVPWAVFNAASRGVADTMVDDIEDKQQNILMCP